MFQQKKIRTWAKKAPNKKLYLKGTKKTNKNIREREGSLARTFSIRKENIVNSSISSIAFSSNTNEFYLTRKQKYVHVNT